MSVLTLSLMKKSISLYELSFIVIPDTFSYQFCESESEVFIPCNVKVEIRKQKDSAKCFKVEIVQYSKLGNNFFYVNGLFVP